MAILITGSAGFIGSHLTRKLVFNYPNERIIALDKLTYAGDLSNISDVLEKNNFRFIQGDICDNLLLDRVFRDEEISALFHLAAESHVDNSINNPLEFVNTNVLGTVNLLEKSKGLKSNPRFTFFHISTDEVFGSLSKNEASFTEKSKYFPNSPYSASKAASDHFVRAYGETYGMQYLITNCSNNFGPNQHEEKLIPVVIKSIIQKKHIPVYGDGKNVRDWLYVGDHVDALLSLFNSKYRNETFCIGGGVELCNLELIQILCEETDKILGNKFNSDTLIKFVTDRAGHDFRYSINNSKITKATAWSPSYDFKSKIRETIKYYLRLFQFKNNK